MFKIWLGYFVLMLGIMSQICVQEKIYYITHQTQKMVPAPLEDSWKFLYNLWTTRFPSDWNLTLPGSVQHNKPESVALFLNGRRSLFFHLCCTRDLAPLSYVTDRNKALILFSRKHHDDMRIAEAQDHKFEIIVHYNDNGKGYTSYKTCERMYLYEINKAQTLDSILNLILFV